MKKSILGLFNEVMEPKDCNVTDRNRDLCQELDGRGSLAVDVITSQLFAFREQHGQVPTDDDPRHLNFLYFLCVVIRDNMESKHAVSVAQMLLWPEIKQGQMGGSSIYMLSAGLKDKGGLGVVPYLKQFVEREKSIGNLTLATRTEAVIKKCQKGKST